MSNSSLKSITDPFELVTENHHSHTVTEKGKNGDEFWWAAVPQNFPPQCFSIDGAKGFHDIKEGRIGRFCEVKEVHLEMLHMQ